MVLKISSLFSSKHVSWMNISLKSLHKNNQKYERLEKSKIRSCWITIDWKEIIKASANSLRKNHHWKIATIKPTHQGALCCRFTADSPKCCYRYTKTNLHHAGRSPLQSPQGPNIPVGRPGRGREQALAAVPNRVGRLRPVRPEDGGYFQVKAQHGHDRSTATTLLWPLPWLPWLVLAPLGSNPGGWAVFNQRKSLRCFFLFFFLKGVSLH